MPSYGHVGRIDVVDGTIVDMGGGRDDGAEMGKVSDGRVKTQLGAVTSSCQWEM